MKKLATLSAAVILSAAFATGASAAPVEDVVAPEVEEPIVEAEDVVIAPNPIELLEITYIYGAPQGDAISALAPQMVHPTGSIVGDWVEIYTWLGTTWIYLPGYVPSYL
ncbi:hypothetical protein V3851_17050 [Paenibacillus sp. M1]|uniref:SH3 domain-containing protein n=1 Tax=Paenibacillus haidiansis TaxID=1574488 RepID=A0ABU7VUV0_9BACL